VGSSVLGVLLHVHTAFRDTSNLLWVLKKNTLRVLILGGEGMLGHKMFQVLRDRADTFSTFRKKSGLWEQHPIYADVNPTHTLAGVDVLNMKSVVDVFIRVNPDAIVNCIGLVKQRGEAKDTLLSIQVNALFPHQLARICEDRGIRLIHLSTDCVFSGNRGHYSESDLADPIDLYGHTKLLGELNQPGCLTLRTSIVGWEMKHKLGLLEWFATQRHRTIEGYRLAIYSGVSTTALGTLILELLEAHPKLHGLYHVASHPITKYDLLVRLRDTLGWQDIDISPDDQFRCDRSLVGSRLETATGWRVPTWDEMIDGLALEWPTYERWRSKD